MTTNATNRMVLKGKVQLRYREKPAWEFVSVRMVLKELLPGGVEVDI